MQRDESNRCLRLIVAAASLVAASVSAVGALCRIAATLSCCLLIGAAVCTYTAASTPTDSIVFSAAVAVEC